MKGLLLTVLALLVGNCQVKKFLVEIKDGGNSGNDAKDPQTFSSVIEDPGYIEGKPSVKKRSKFRSGGFKCPRYSTEERDKNKGNCRDNEKCRWFAPGETIKTEGCKVMYCRHNGKYGLMSNGCKMCKLPGKNDKWMPISNRQQSCEDPENPSDLCSCKAGNPPELVVDKDGANKGKKCPHPVTMEMTEHRAGNPWDCWIDQFGCYSECSCKDLGRGIQHGYKLGDFCSKDGTNCPKYSIEERDRNKGNCRDHKKCRWVAPGETIKTVGCTVHFCTHDGREATMRNGCKMCKLPGKNNKWIGGDAPQSCEDPENPSDLCSCKAGNPPELVVDKGGANKGKKCPHPETQELTEHRVGETWDCWMDKWSCYATCTCKDWGGGTSTSVSGGSGCFG